MAGGGERQHQGMDRPGVCKVPEGSGGQGKMEEMVVKSSVVPQRPQQLRIDNDDDDERLVENEGAPFRNRRSF